MLVIIPKWQKTLLLHKYILHIHKFQLPEFQMSNEYKVTIKYF